MSTTDHNVKLRTVSEDIESGGYLRYLRQRRASLPIPALPPFSPHLTIGTSSKLLKRKGEKTKKEN